MNRQLALKLLVQIGLLAITVLAVRACLPTRTVVQQTNPAAVDRRLIIIPTDGIPDIFLTALRSRLKEQHKFEVLIAIQMPLDADMVIEKTAQLEASRVARAGADLCRRMATANEYCVVLTNRDINAEKSGLRYLFAQHHKGVSVVSLARMNDANFGAKLDLVTVPLLFEKTLERATKLINKGLGLGYYGYAISSDRRSVMYSPILSVADLDAMGNWCLENEVRRDNY